MPMLVPELPRAGLAHARSRSFFSGRLVAAVRSLLALAAFAAVEPLELEAAVEAVVFGRFAWQGND